MGSGPTAVNAPSIASSGRWSVQVMELIPRRARPRRPRIRDVVGVKPGGIAPAVFVVVRKTLLGQRDHAIERAAGARAPQRLEADILVVAGVIHLVELVPAAELRANRVPQELHYLDALLVIDAV